MKKSFTLIELLIVIAIIAILALGIIILTMPGQRLAQARDATRASHLKNLETALYLYAVDEGTYPFGLSSTLTEICNTDQTEICGDLIDLSTLGIAIPIDPQGGVNPDGTGYFVALYNNRIYLSAPQAETKIVSIGEILTSNWPDELGYIYNEGEHDDMWVEGYNEGVVLTKGENYLQFSPGEPHEAAWVTSETIDLSGHDTLKVQFTVTAPSANLFRNKVFAAAAPTAVITLVVSTEQMSNKDVYDFRYQGVIEYVDTLFSLPIESAESSYYIRVHANPPYYDTYITEAWLE